MRKKPYTAIGISRVPCARCDAPSTAQWQVCADGNQWRGLCAECDYDLNSMVLGFMCTSQREEKMSAYRKKVGLPFGEVPF
jgi:hypothetical protein